MRTIKFRGKDIFYELHVPIVDSTVVGNIHDDKKLLEKGAKK